MHHGYVPRPFFFNLATISRISSIEDHPIKRLMELGVKTTINSDDPGVMGISLMTEYNLAFNGLKMSLEQLEKCNLWAADSSFICTEKKARVFP